MGQPVSMVSILHLTMKSMFSSRVYIFTKQTMRYGESSWFALPGIPIGARTVTVGEQTAKAIEKSSAASNATSHEKCFGSSQTLSPFMSVPIYAPLATTPTSPFKPPPNNSTLGPSGSHESNEDSSTTTNSPTGTTMATHPKSRLTPIGASASGVPGRR